MKSARNDSWRIYGVDSMGDGGGRMDDWRDWMKSPKIDGDTKVDVYSKFLLILCICQYYIVIAFLDQVWGMYFQVLDILRHLSSNWTPSPAPT